MRGKTNPRTRYSRPGNRAERYLYRGTNRYTLLSEWKKRTACRIGRKKRSIFVIKEAISTLETCAEELSVSFQEITSATLDIYFRKRMKGNFPIFFEYKNALHSLVQEWYHENMELDIQVQPSEIDEDLLSQLRS